MPPGVTEAAEPPRVRVAPVDALAARREHRLIRFSDKVERLRKEKAEAEEEIGRLRQTNRDLAAYLALQIQQCDPSELSELRANLEQMRQEVGRLLKENEEIRVEKHASEEYETTILFREKRARLEAEVQVKELHEEVEAMKTEMVQTRRPDAAILKEKRRRAEAEVLVRELREEVGILRAEIKTLREGQKHDAVDLLGCVKVKMDDMLE